MKKEQIAELLLTQPTELYYNNPPLEEGEWQKEPSKVVWIDPDTALDCMIIRNGYGALCGYVGVKQDHVFFGISDSTLSGWGSLDDDDDDEKAPEWPTITVHGGLTFSGKCHGHICHKSDEGHSATWWLGFDCAHSCDYQPGSPITKSGTYKNLAYVVREVKSLAVQFVDANEKLAVIEIVNESND